MRPRTRHSSIVVVLFLAACGGSGGPSAARDTLPPNVVPERAAAWSRITVRSTGDGREADVPAAMKPKAAPLLTGRLLSSPESPAAYGLDAPTVTITYRGPTRTRMVLIGHANFDGHGYYVQRQGDPRVFLVPADQLQPLLALVR